MRFIVAVLITFILTLLFPQKALAIDVPNVINSYMTESDDVITRVGNPKEEIVTNDVVKAATQLRRAYVECGKPAGATFITPLLPECLQKHLAQYGHSESKLAAFESRRKNTITGLQCTECLGYVALVLTLMTGDTNTLTQNSPADTIQLTSFSAGPLTFTKLPKDTQPQSGDIGLTIRESAGHILIVKSRDGNEKFTAIESNWGSSCLATDDQTHRTDFYEFYRK